MELSAAGLDLIKKSEGLRTRTYLDLAGLPTIGYGHRVLSHELFPEEISESQADNLLAADACQAGRAVERLVKVVLTQGQFDALTDFCFNLGAGRLASSTLLKALNLGRYEAAREQLLRWDLAGCEVSPGLKARREAEFQIWANGLLNQEAAA